MYVFKTLVIIEIIQTSWYQAWLKWYCFSCLFWEIFICEQTECISSYMIDGTYGWFKNC